MSRGPPTPTRTVVCFLNIKHQASMVFRQAEMHNSSLLYISQNLNNEIKVSNKMII